MKFINVLFAILLLLNGCSKKQFKRTEIDLSGKWEFSMDTANVGESQKWYLNSFDESVLLPGTMDENHKGFANKDTTTMHLNRLFTYAGAAWYKKEVTIPESFANKHIELFIERTKPAKVWVDDVYVGENRLLQTPHLYDLTKVCNPGNHIITVKVNNDLSLTPYGNVHIYSDDTQTNWNGMLGDLKIISMPKTYIKNVEVFPDVKAKSFGVDLKVINGLNWDNVDIKLNLKSISRGNVQELKVQKNSVPCDSLIHLNYDLGDDCLLWDEFQQPMYQLQVVISKGENKDVKTVSFGMRQFKVDGTQFAINGRKTFLRGKHEAAVFPLTGHPPMDVNGWERVYKIAKSYGLNHYRFHSYCPPEAAFIAADNVGMYLQVELPFWGGLTDSVQIKLRKEGLAMLDAYANHPSFVMFSQGNEIWGGIDYVEENVKAFEEHDNRPLYAMGSNNGIGYIEPFKEAEYFVGARIPNQGNSNKAHTRLIHSFADADEGGILNSTTPSTMVNYDFPVSQMHMPIVSHEIGQFQIYPDYKEIKKYTGVLKAWNLEKFKQKLESQGMGDMDSIFQKSTGAWSALCYKAEMEAAIRTAGFAGFQLLDLQDFPGQGTALVGILDAFMDSKGVITPEAWRESCNDVVVLGEFEKFCWTSSESFSAKVTIANYSNKDLKGDVNWSLLYENGKVFKKGVISSDLVTNQGLTDVGNIETDLSSITKPSKLILSLDIENGLYTNHYPIWVYPDMDKKLDKKGIIETNKLNSSVLAKLKEGASVLYFPMQKDMKENSYAGLFPPEFWNYGMFKGICENVKKPVSPGTLGLLMNPEHPIFNLFPTDFHTSWQWFSIIKSSRSLILDSLGKEYHPIVQVIDNLERNHKLGIVFEFKVGNGKLLVCTSDLLDNLDKPEVNSFYHSIINYMQSDFFIPNYAIDKDKLKKLFY